MLVPPALLGEKQENSCFPVFLKSGAMVPERLPAEFSDCPQCPGRRESRGLWPDSSRIQVCTALQAIWRAIR